MRASRTIVVALAIACIGCGRSAEDWRAGLSDPDPFRRGMSALALARVAPAECADAIPRLLEFVDGPDEGLRTAARGELARVARHHVPLLLANFTGVEGASTDFRSALREALVAAGADAVGPLRAKLTDGGVSNPKQLGQMLADIGESAVAPLVSDLADPDRMRRLCSVWTLGRIGRKAESAAPELTRILEHDEPSVAGQAALALAEVAPLEETTRPALEAALVQRTAESADLVREALARLALNRAGLGRIEDTQARLFALGAQAFVPAVEACASQVQALRSAGERHLRTRYAALALGLPPERLGTPREPARLQARLDDREPLTRARTALEIATLGARGAGFVQPLAARRSDAHAGVALSAELALLHIVRCLALEGARSRP